MLIPRRRHTPQPAAQPASRNVEAEYPYTTETGELAYLVRRFQGKKIRQFHRQNGRLQAGRGDAPLVPYRLPDVIAANRAGDTIYIVEGEKDADTLAEHGLTATCNVGGAGKWTDNLDGWFAGAKVVILPDNDQPGHDHAQDVKTHLDGVAETVRIVTLPGLPDKGDVTDWLTEHTPQDLEQLAHQTQQPTQEFNLSPGGYIFDVPMAPEPIWGDNQDVLWASGEPIMIYGPTGIGKTTVAGRLLLSLIGIDPPELLGHRIHPTSRRVLYVAADRPRQAMRSLRRMTRPEHRDTLDQRLLIEHQRQLWASEDDKSMLLRAAEQAEADIVFLDSGKDIAAGPLKDEAAAKALMDSIQLCIANDVDVLLLHHPRKLGQDHAGKNFDLDDVYGSAWLTAGVGSVLLVAGAPGTGFFTLSQLKAPANFVDEMNVAVNYDTGELARRNLRDLLEWFKDLGTPMTIRQAAAYLHAIPEEAVDFTGKEYKSAERELKRLVTNGALTHLNDRSPHQYQWKPQTRLEVPK